MKHLWFISWRECFKSFKSLIWIRLFLASIAGIARQKLDKNPQWIQRSFAWRAGSFSPPPPRQFYPKTPTGSFTPPPRQFYQNFSTPASYSASQRSFLRKTKYIYEKVTCPVLTYAGQAPVHSTETIRLPGVVSKTCRIWVRLDCIFTIHTPEISTCNQNVCLLNLVCWQNRSIIVNRSLIFLALDYLFQIGVDEILNLYTVQKWEPDVKHFYL